MLLVSAQAHAQSVTRSSSLPSPSSVPSSSLNHQQPAYPGFATLYGLHGTVTVLVLVGTDGHPKDVKVETSSGYRELDEAAVNAARTWSFSPEIKNGIAAEAYVRTPVAFNWSGFQKPSRASTVHYEEDPDPIPYSSVEEALADVSKIAEIRPKSNTKDPPLLMFGVQSTDGSKERWFFTDVNTDDAMVVRYTHTFTPDGIKGKVAALCKKGPSFCERRMPWILKGP